jgi:hypothetical protein
VLFLKKKKQDQQQTSLDFFSVQDLINAFTPTQQAIVKCLIDGMYQSMISRRLELSKTYVSRFCQFLEDHKLIEKDYKDPLQRRATTYRVDIRLRQANYDDKSDFTLCLPHRVRFGAPMVKRSKKISKTTGRFSNAQVKFIHSYKPKGGERNVFEMKHPTVGKIGIIAHQHSIEVYQAERHRILAKDIPEASFILSMALREAAARFVQEQEWNGTEIQLGDFHMIGSPHYAFESADAKRAVIDTGKTQMKVLDGKGIVDDSLKHLGNGKRAEVEFMDEDDATDFDRKLRRVDKLDRELPEMIQLEVTKSLTDRATQSAEINDELASLRGAITGINEAVQRIDTSCNSVVAACQGGTPMFGMNGQLEQLYGIVARQGESIHLVQQSMTGIIDSMNKIITGIDNRANDSDRQRLAMADEVIRLRNENEQLRKRHGEASI